MNGPVSDATQGPLMTPKPTIATSVKLAETLAYVKPLRRQQCLRLFKLLGGMAAIGAGLAHVYSIRIRPGGSDSSYRLARSDRPIGTNPLIFAVCIAGTPDFSSLLAIKPRKGMGRSRLRSSTTRAARRNRICRSSNSGVVQSKLWNA